MGVCVWGRGGGISHFPGLPAPVTPHSKPRDSQRHVQYSTPRGGIRTQRGANPGQAQAWDRPTSGEGHAQTWDRPSMGHARATLQQGTGTRGKKLGTGPSMAWRALKRRLATASEKSDKRHGTARHKRSFGQSNTSP